MLLMSLSSVIELFPNIVSFLIFYILWLIWFIFEMIFSWTTPFIRSKGRIVFDDMGSTVLIIIGSVSGFVLIVYLSLNEILLLPSWFIYAGLVLFASGMLFRFWAILTLGRYFSPIVGIYKEHALVKTGPYRYVRHPSYSGALLMLFSYALIMRSLIGGIVVFCMMLLIYLYRIKVEEKVLEERFADKYREYSKNRKKLIPWII